MGRYTILVAVAAMIVVGILESPVAAQTRAGVGIGGIGGHGPGHTGAFLGSSNFGFTTLFDLYRTGQIPVPPYFSLHPPVYYGENVRQPYGATPFAFPYTWWQQQGFGQTPVPPYASPSPRTVVYTHPRSRMIYNPYVTEDPAAADAATGVIRNPFVKVDGSDDEKLSSTGIIENPFVAKPSTAVANGQSEAAEASSSSIVERASRFILSILQTAPPQAENDEANQTASVTPLPRRES